MRHGAAELSSESLLRILDVCHKLAESYDLVQLLTEIVESGKDVLLAERGSLWLYDAVKRELELKVPQRSPPIRIPSGQGLAGECLESRQVINVPEAYSDPRFNRTVDLITGFRTHSVLSIPLLGRQGEPVGVMQLLNKQGGEFEHNDELLAIALAGQCAVALQRTQLTEALFLKERLDEEVSLARKIQMSSLPSIMPVVPDYDLHGEFRPADQTGGDMFDLVVLQDQLFILLGDATGHGIGSALSATQMQAMLRVAFRCGAGLAEAYRHVNNQLVEDLPADRFLTAFIGFLDPSRNEVTYYSGGQGPLLHFHAADMHCEWLKPTHFPVGILPVDDLGAASTIHMEPGDLLVLLSDGIYEFANEQGALFGEEGVKHVILRHHHLPMAELGRELLQAVFRFGGDEKQADDITVVLLRRLAAA